jgi:hypothetical protein
VSICSRLARVAMIAFGALASLAIITATTSTNALAAAGTPVLFTNQVLQPNGIAANQSEVLVTAPACQQVPYGTGADNWLIQSIAADGSVIGTFSTVHAPYDPTSPITNPTGDCAEVHVAISPGEGGFTANNVFATFGGYIYQIPAGGGAPVLFVHIPSLDVPFPHTDITFDTVGSFANEMLLVGEDVQNNVEVWKVDSAGNTLRLATILPSVSACGPALGIVPEGNGAAACGEGPAVVPLTGPVNTATGLGGELFIQLSLAARMAAVSDSGTTDGATVQVVGPFHTGEDIQVIPDQPCTFAPNGVDTGLTYFAVNFAPYSGVFPNHCSDSGLGAIPPGDSVYAYPATNFVNLGGYLIEDNEGDDGNIVTTNGAYPDESLFDTACYANEKSAIVQCAVQGVGGGLTWGYWKTHTGSMAPAQDPTYLTLSSTCPATGGLPPVYANGAITLDTDCDTNDLYQPTVVTSPSDADDVFSGGNAGKVNCGHKFKGAKCVTLFTAQLLAAKLNVRKFAAGGFGSAIYSNPSDPTFNGQSVNTIMSEMQTAFDVFVDAANGTHNGNPKPPFGVCGSDFVACQNTLDAINNNGEGTPVLINP